MTRPRRCFGGPGTPRVGRWETIIPTPSGSRTTWATSSRNAGGSTRPRACTCGRWRDAGASWATTTPKRSSRSITWRRWSWNGAGTVGPRPWLREAVQGRRRLGLDHPDLAGSLALLGRLLLETDRPREAESPLREALAIRRKALAEGHWQTAYTGELARRLPDTAGAFHRGRAAPDRRRRGARQGPRHAPRTTPRVPGSDRRPLRIVEQARGGRTLAREANGCLLPARPVRPLRNAEVRSDSRLVRRFP